MIYQNSFQNWIFDLDNTIYDINLGLFKKNFSFIDYSFNNLSEFLDTIKMRG